MLVDLTLIAVVKGAPNENGYITDVEHRRTVIADRTSVKRTEFYEAYKAGIKPTAVFSMRPADYADDYGREPTYAVEGDTRYEIIRTYETSPDEIELTCARVT